MAALTAALALAAPAAAFANDGNGESDSHQGKNGSVVTTTTPAAGSSQAAQGIVQSVSGGSVVVKQLDGSTVTVPVDRKGTQVFVNNRHAQWSDVKPGYVLTASWKAGKPAPTLRITRS